MEEAIQMGLEPTLRRYNLNIESVSRWVKNFKTSNVKSSIELAESIQRELRKLPKAKPQNDEFSDKADEFYRVVASLIVEIVLKKGRYLESDI